MKGFHASEQLCRPQLTHRSTILPKWHKNIFHIKLHSQHFTFEWKLLVIVLFFPTDDEFFLNRTARTVPKAVNFFWMNSSSRSNGWLERIAQTVRKADNFFERINNFFEQIAQAVWTDAKFFERIALSIRMDANFLERIARAIRTVSLPVRMANERLSKVNR